MKSRRESGSAVVEFTLITMILVPLVLGIIQVALCLHVRNTLTSAASEGARAAALDGATLDIGTQVTRERISDSLAGNYADQISSQYARADGIAVVEVIARADVPALGLFGPGISFEVTGRAIVEQLE